MAKSFGHVMGYTNLQTDQTQHTHTRTALCNRVMLLNPPSHFSTDSVLDFRLCLQMHWLLSIAVAKSIAPLIYWNSQMTFKINCWSFHLPLTFLRRINAADLCGIHNKLNKFTWNWRWTFSLGTTLSRQKHRDYISVLHFMENLI